MNCVSLIDRTGDKIRDVEIPMFRILMDLLYASDLVYLQSRVLPQCVNIYRETPYPYPGPSPILRSTSILRSVSSSLPSTSPSTQEPSQIDLRQVPHPQLERSAHPHPC